MFKYRPGQAQERLRLKRHVNTAREHFSCLVNFSVRSQSFAKSCYYVDSTVWFAKWQLKANTKHLNLWTGVFGSGTRCWRKSVW